MYKKLFITLLMFLIVMTGSSLLGQTRELEEPFDVDIPEEFSESPDFEKLVEVGELPPVEKRLPEEPLVIEPYEDIGDYGGTINSATLGLNSYGEDTILMDSFNSFVKPSSFGDELYLNFARDIEVSENMDTYTFHLREGVKWSDGEPFTTEDIEFWYEDMLLNEELTPAISIDYKDKNGEVMDLTVIDDYTFKIEFGSSKPFFLEDLVHNTGWDWIYPKHYLKDFHPAYTDEEKLEEIMQNEDFDEWYELFDYKNESIWGQQKLREEAPTLGPYILESKSSERRVYKRNPYYWKVDSAGNQLPYIDKIETDLASDMEVLNGRILSGEIDFATMHTDIRNFPMFKNYEDEGNYKTLEWTSGMANDVVYMFNHTHEDKDMREIFQNTEFKKAMSLAIDRDEINETIYFGRAEPSQMTVVPESKYYKSEFSEAYIEYDPERAEKKLDEIGLVDQNGDGWRELPNGDEFNFTVEAVVMETPKQPNAELVVEHWQDVGIDVTWRDISGELAEQRAPANMIDSYIWHGDAATDILFPVDANFYVPIAPGWSRSTWPLWARWVSSNGEEGEEPPAQIKEIIDWHEEMLVEPDKEKRIELGQKILEKQAENLWAIGTVGRAPWVTVANNNLRNLPDDSMMVWDVLWTMSDNPEQFYFEGGKKAQ
ncbi:MAG: ABC transporter substrate-binding protein [Candidatus Woesearchaeota archaeon]